MMNVGDIMTTVGCSVHWGYEYTGGYQDACGVIMNAPENVQYTEGIP